MISREVRTGVVISAFIAAFWCWWIAASDYGDPIAVGTYHFSQAGVTCELVLKPDHTFVQELKSAGIRTHAVGTWHRVGEGGITFSSAFLAIPGEQIEPDGTTFADVHKLLGFVVTLHMRRYHVLWYGRSDPETGTSPVGTYYGDEEGVKASLVLHPNHSFKQEIIRSGVSATAEGTWASGANGAITFSRAFLKTSGKPMENNESATADDPRGSNLQILIANTSSSGEPIFRKKPHFW